MTRIIPGRVEIAEDFEAVTQRYASVVFVKRSNADQIEFLRPPPSIREAKGLGALFFLPADQQNVIGMREVFSLIQASSAFPGAFAPVELKYSDPNKLGCRGDALAQCGDSALFSDGGVFDNNPIDLAAGIYNAAVWENDSSADPNAVMIYIDPEALRGELQAGREEKTPPAARRGIDVLLQLFAGAVPSARQYELQSFARLLERAPQVFVRENIKVTDRALPVVSEQLGAFAGFLGKPFREADFYVGVYDALNFFAREACETNEGVDSACVPMRLGQFVETPLFTFGDAGSPSDTGDDELGGKVVRALYQWEHTGAHADSIFGFDPSGHVREILVFALLRANSRIADGFDSEPCTAEKDPIKALLCLGGFRLLLQDFANDTVRQAIGRALGQHPNECRPEDWFSAAARCVVDESFESLIDSPEEFMAKTIGLFLHQLWRVERSLVESDLHNWAGVTSLSEITYQSTVGYRYRRGFDLNTSTVPRGSGKAWLAAMVPNYVSTTIGRSGFEFGYRPTFHINTSLAVGVNGVPLHVIHDAPNELDTYRWSIGPRILWKPSWSVVLVSGLETGVDLFGRWRRTVFGDEADRVWSIPVNAYLVGNKFRVGVQFLPDNDSAVHGGSWWSVSIGVADVNGLVYWMLRPLF